MERRVRRLEVASKSALLRQLATVVAADFGLDPELVLREAEVILAEWSGLSLPEIATREGFDLAEREAEAHGLLARLKTTPSA
jgi:hypothetical protein